MTKERWNYIKALKPSFGRLVWRSNSTENVRGQGTFNDNRSARKHAVRENARRG